MSQAEEVAQGHKDARVLLIVPVHLEQDFTIVIRVGHLPIQPESIVYLKDRHRCTGLRRIEKPWPQYSAAELCHPDVCNASRSLEISQDGGFPWSYDPIVLVATSLIPTRNPSTAGMMGVRQARQQAAERPTSHD